MQQKYGAMADIVDQEIRLNLSGAPEELLDDQDYWEGLLIDGVSVFKDEVYLYDSQGEQIGGGGARDMADAAFSRRAEKLPYIIAVFERYPLITKTLEDKEENLTFYISIIIFSAFSILGGSIFTLSALSREWRQAKLKSEFASHLSHDLRRPLTSIRMFSEMLKSGDVQSEAKKNEYYGIISEESDKLTHLANNILDFSRIEEGRRKYNIQEEDITRIVIETVERFKVYMINEKRRITLHVDPVKESKTGKNKGGYPIAKADAGAVSQALMNLLTNADKYSPGDKDIVINLKNAGKHAVIEVVDQGEGIPRDEQKKVFQKFYRVSRKNISETEGTGLGLALVKYTAEAHGGRITLESEVGKGSTFSIWLPV
jgi:signal transduction histidine kinase